MIDRKKKVRITQLTLLIAGLIIIYLTYYNKNNVNDKKELVSKSAKEITESIDRTKDAKGDMFFDIEYTGLDLNGNRYLLKSKEAYLDSEKPEVVYMGGVHAIFYFKDDTVLNIWADKGIYNNKSLDMKFEKNVKARYLESELFSERAEYSNTENYLSVNENVRINDAKGNLIADKLLFDITKQKLDITSFKNNKVNAKLRLNEK